MTVEEIVNKLISGKVVCVPDDKKEAVRAKLREIKKHCIVVLSQIKNNY